MSGNSGAAGKAAKGTAKGAVKVAKGAAKVGKATAKLLIGGKRTWQ